MKRNKLVLCLDFDGVIHSYESGWRGPRTIPDLPVPGALEFIVKAMEHFDIHIFSSRSRYFGGRWAMKRWLWDRYAELGGVKKTGWPLPFRQFDVNLTIPEIPKWYWNSILEYTSMEPWEWEVHYGIKRLLKKIKFPTKKPPAFLIIDDRAYTFRGIFPDPRTLLNFKPWNKTHLADPSGADIGVTSEKIKN